MNKNNRFLNNCLRRQGCSVWSPRWMLRDRPCSPPSRSLTQSRNGLVIQQRQIHRGIRSTLPARPTHQLATLRIPHAWTSWSLSESGWNPSLFLGDAQTLAAWLGRQHVGGAVPISSADGERGLTRSEREDGYLAPCWPAQESNWTIRPREMHRYPTPMLPSVVGMLRGYDWPRDGRCSC